MAVRWRDLACFFHLIVESISPFFLSPPFSFFSLNCSICDGRNFSLGIEKVAFGLGFFTKGEVQTPLILLCGCAL